MSNPLNKNSAKGFCRVLLTVLILAWFSPQVAQAVTKADLVGSWDLEQQYCTDDLTLVDDEMTVIPRPEKFLVTFTTSKVDLQLSFYGCSYRIVSPYNLSKAGILTYTNREVQTCNGDKMDLDPVPFKVTKQGSRLYMKVATDEGMARICDSGQRPVFVLRRL